MKSPVGKFVPASSTVRGEPFTSAKPPIDARIVRLVTRSIDRNVTATFCDLHSSAFAVVIQARTNKTARTRSCVTAFTRGAPTLFVIISAPQSCVQVQQPQPRTSAQRGARRWGSRTARQKGGNV